MLAEVLGTGPQPRLAVDGNRPLRERDVTGERERAGGDRGDRRSAGDGSRANASRKRGGKPVRVGGSQTPSAPSITPSFGRSPIRA